MLVRALLAAATFIVVLMPTSAVAPLPATATVSLAHRTGFSNLGTEPGMPTVLLPASGQVESQAPPHLLVSYTDAERGFYRLTVTCQSGPDAEPLRWSKLWRRGKASWTHEQEFTASGGLPPGATCSASVRRDSDGATTAPVAFDVVWGDAIVYLEPVPARVWPAAEDGADQLSFVAHVREPGDYIVEVWGRNDLATMLDLGHLDPGRYVASWDVKRRNGAPAAEGTYRAYLHGDLDPPYLSDVMSDSRRFAVRYSTESATFDDKRGERGSRHVDVNAFNLTTAPDRVEVKFRFRTLRRASLSYLSVGLDVNRLTKGFLLTATANREGHLRPRLALAHLASDVGLPTPIRCSGLRVTVDRRSATLTVPRSCMSRGGRSVRAYYSAGDGHYHYDGGPDFQRSLWTSWLTYENPPR